MTDPQTPSPPPFPDITPGAHASPTGKKRSPVLIVVMIVAVLVLCCGIAGIASCAGLISLGGSDGVADIADPMSVTGTGVEADVEAEAGRMVKHFYPSFTLEALYPGESMGDLVDYVVVVHSDEVAGFRMAFRASREPDEADYTPLEGEYVDPETGALWLGRVGFEPQTSTLEDWAGADAPLTPPKMRQAVQRQFVDAHADLVVTDFDLTNNIDFGFRGIRVDEVEGWDGSAVSFTSTWKSDLAAGGFKETSFAD